MARPRVFSTREEYEKLMEVRYSNKIGWAFGDVKLCQKMDTRTVQEIEICIVSLYLVPGGARFWMIVCLEDYEAPLDRNEFRDFQIIHLKDNGIILADYNESTLTINFTFQDTQETELKDPANFPDYVTDSDDFLGYFNRVVKPSTPRKYQYNIISLKFDLDYEFKLATRYLKDCWNQELVNLTPLNITNVTQTLNPIPHGNQNSLVSGEERPEDFTALAEEVNKIKL